MPAPEDGWTNQDVSLRFETLQAQIQRMAVSIDGITAQVHPNMEEIKYYGNTFLKARKDCEVITF